MLANIVNTLKKHVFTAFDFNRYIRFCINKDNHAKVCIQYKVQGNPQRAVIYYMNSLMSGLKNCIASDYTSSSLTNTRAILKECESSFNYNKFVTATLVIFAIICLGYGITKFITRTPVISIRRSRIRSNNIYKEINDIDKRGGGGTIKSQYTNF